MISPRVFLFATLTLAAIVNAQASIDVRAPVNFNYKKDDTLDVNIFLHCLPENASTYALFYETDNCDVIPQCLVPARSEIIPENRTIIITQRLSERSVTIYIELSNQSNISVTKKQVILTGSTDENADKNPFHQNCLNKQNQHESKCQINVKFEDQCEERAAKIDCTQKDTLTCQVVDEELPEDTVHQWYQVHENGFFIEHTPQLKGKITEFKMILQKFDNNTNIYSIMKSTNLEKDLVSQKFKVSLPKNGFKPYDIQHTKHYAENEPINFFCPNDTYHTQVGLIDPTGDNIALPNKTFYIGPYNKKMNNSMLCCISYKYNYIYNKKVVERSVKNITLIIMKPENQNNVKGGKTTHKFGRRLSAQSADMSTSTEQGNRHPISLPWIITAGIAGTILLVAIIYVAGKRWCRKPSNPEQSLQLETYGTNMVLYAELDIRPGPTQPPPTVEDPTYAQIIGVLRPKSELVNK